VRVRQRFFNLTSKADRKMFTMELTENQNNDGYPVEPHRTKYFLRDAQGRRVQVCNTFWRDVFCVPTDYAKNSKRIEQAHRERSHPKAELVSQWLADVEKFHEYMPDVTGAGRREKPTEKVHPLALVAPPPVMVHTGVQLPYPSQIEFYAHFTNDHLGEDDKKLIPTIAYFCKVWKQRFPHVHLRKNLRFAKCDVCIYYREMIGTYSRRDEKDRSKLRAEFQQHLTAIRAERETYHKKRHEATLSGASALSIIFDGADQGAYG
jgi:hypothetical protein